MRHITTVTANNVAHAVYYGQYPEARTRSLTTQESEHVALIEEAVREAAEAADWDAEALTTTQSAELSQAIAAAAREVDAEAAR